MRGHTLAFIATSFCFLTLCRLLLCAWQWQRIQAAGGLWPVLKGGLRIDAAQIAMLSGIPLILGPWLGHYPFAGTITVSWLLIAWFVLVLLEASTPQFIFEYDTRPNRLYVEYLKHPKEVFSMLWKGYRLAISGALLSIALLMWVGYLLFGQDQVDAPLLWRQRIFYTLIAVPLIFLAIRGTLGHRPINPSTVAYCGDGMLNTLPLNSLYSVLYAIYSMKNERSASDVYGKLANEQVSEEVNLRAGIIPCYADIPSLHIQEPTCKRTKPLNLVMIVEESLGAQYVKNLGGSGLTPCIDDLATESWNFRRAYATGTRSVRGLEALVSGFPPTISDAALRLSGAQRNFFTLAQVLKQHDYRSRFIYGGEAHFDNMKSFFLGNGFDELHDLPTFDEPAFVGTWGASDEDMFNKLDALLSNPPSQPTFSLAFSVSNHSPWEYPQGRIEVNDDPATIENTVRYADWALGKFFEKAKASDYWKDTVFLVVADHDSRVFGANLVPLRHFHIPALILGADIQPRQDDRIISQIDLPTTLLSLIGVLCEHPMIGRDLTKADCNRAMMQYGENYGYLKGDKLLVLEPHRAPTQYEYAAPASYTPQSVEDSLFKEALSHVLWPTWAYKNHYYTLPHLRPALPTAQSLP
ncbi:TPA: LTA synthase family protein [Pseudomonas aeruginosa]|uniref:Phosphoglycerol transferase MdoB n=2 Tax=Alcaligenaceae TaxID=506 RepID=A0A1M6BX11_9BURK|nr:MULTISPECIES: LTA synthase family protein [Alcaligenaceae]QCS62039.1 LTA synthase family protein [Achromobacter denitrificans]TFL08012.1 LTA synthase family protein [Pusillimonas caeni]SHI53038.1 Phosphoglycerol transferase MdoB [Pollutimonas bauzanensis]